MSNQSRGSYAERKVADALRAGGWLYKGTGDAHGAVDGIALKAGERALILQIKGTKRPFDHFRPEERAEFLQEAEAAGWPMERDAFLIWAPPDRKPPRWIPPEKWPATKTGGEA